MNMRGLKMNTNWVYFIFRILLAFPVFIFWSGATFFLLFLTGFIGIISIIFYPFAFFGSSQDFKDVCWEGIKALLLTPVLPFYKTYIYVKYGVFEE